MANTLEKGKYGKTLKNKPGWILEKGEGIYNHRFGGNSWTVNAKPQHRVEVALLLSLDLADPKLVDLKIGGLSSIPLCSYINCDIWLETQRFTISPDTNTITILECTSHYSSILDIEDQYPIPLPEISLVLREMCDIDYLMDETAYWEACDGFLGGDSFIRVLGPPLWLQDNATPLCVCGNFPRYVGSIGYENYSTNFGIVGGRPFFIGEAALYFFLCYQCLILTTISQSS